MLAAGRSIIAGRELLFLGGYIVAVGRSIIAGEIYCCWLQRDLLYYFSGNHYHFPYKLLSTTKLNLVL